MGSTEQFKSLTKSFFSRFGIGITAQDRLHRLDAIEKDLEKLFEIILSAYDLKTEARSQLHQDLFVLLLTKFKRCGFFVEFGATNGVELSNTYLLEKKFDWNGILAEPSPNWHKALRQNRNVIVDFDCVWKETGAVLDFHVAPEAELSTLAVYAEDDHHAPSRRNATCVKVRTVTLMDLLEKHSAPNTIDYLSIDTEGSEFDILSDFDFRKYRFSVITVEHNFTPNRSRVYGLLTNHGYQRVLPGISRWDDWYVYRDIP